MFRLFSLVFLLLSLLPKVAFTETTSLRLMHINDVYKMHSQDPRGGLAPLMTLLREERHTADYHLTTFGGDLISPSVLSSITKGQHMIQLMNALDITIATFGNHEFDYGDQVLHKRMEESEFTWLSSNVVEDRGKPFGNAKQHIIHQAGPITIGLFAVLTPDTAFLSSPSTQVQFLDPLKIARKHVTDFNKKGVDLIIAISHQPLQDDILLAHTVPGIDVILGGYDHDALSFLQNDVLIIKAGLDASHLAVVDVDIEKTPDQLTVLKSWRFIKTAKVAPDPQIAALIMSYQDFAQAMLYRPLGKTLVPFDTRKALVRTQENSFANFITDTLRTRFHTDVALINAGSLNGNRLYNAGTTLTYYDVHSELPYKNVPIVITLKGLRTVGGFREWYKYP